MRGHVRRVMGGKGSEWRGRWWWWGREAEGFGWWRSGAKWGGVLKWGEWSGEARAGVVVVVVVGVEW